jgi:hypothetical protein
VRVNSNNQTLILAGEAIPRRDVGSSSAEAFGLSGGRPLTIVATPADDPRLLTQGTFAGNASAAVGESTSSFITISSYQNTLLRSSTVSRGAPFNAAHAYARTQDLTNSAPRAAIIDTYA